MSFSAVVGQVGAAIGFIKMVAPVREAWRRAKQDGVSMVNVPGWWRYMNGADPLAEKRCPGCKKVPERLFPLPKEGHVLWLCDACIELGTGLNPRPSSE